MNLKLVLVTGLMFSTSEASELSRAASQSSDDERTENFFLTPKASEISRTASQLSDDKSVENFFSTKDENLEQLSGSRVRNVQHSNDVEHHTSAARATAFMQDDDRLAAAVEASTKLAKVTKAFQDKQAAAAASPKSPIGNVAFEAVIRDAQNVIASVDPIKLQGAIHSVRAVQRNNILTADQSDRVDEMLIDLACALSVITNHETLGAR